MIITTKNKWNKLWSTQKKKNVSSSEIFVRIEYQHVDSEWISVFGIQVFVFGEWISRVIKKIRICVHFSRIFLRI